jgi:nicotinamidase-related amidase
MQYDLIQSIVPTSRRMALVDAVQTSLCVARAAKWDIVLTRLVFPSNYRGVSPHHKIHGALPRLNAKLGNGKVHWFMEGHAQSEILSSLMAARGGGGDYDKTTLVYRRQEQLPSQTLVTLLRDRDITHVTIVGCKVGYMVQATSQLLCDAAFHRVSVVKECVGDDDDARLEALMKHLIPIYANVVDMVDFIDEAITLDAYTDRPKDAADLQDFDPNAVKYCCDCSRGGHASMYICHLLQREEWQVFPRQTWYTDFFLKTYYCPLGKRVVAFCDEPRFSQISMFLKGREWLDEKEKLIYLAADFMPTTYIIKKRQWIGSKEPSDNNKEEDSSLNDLCWFVKDVNKNGGRAIRICNHVSECMALTEQPDETYVVQQHIAEPLLTNDGRKCHVKFYSLLECNEHAVWKLYTYKDAFLSTSPNQWSPDDISSDTQITVKRNKRLEYGKPVEEWTNHACVWPAAYEKCKHAVADIVERAIQHHKLQVRPAKKQFEVFSADFMLDTSGKLWIIEFNFSPVLYDPSFATEDTLTTDGLKRYHELYLKEGKDAQVNDGDMIRDAVTIAFYDSKDLPSTSKWDAAGEFFS